MAELNELLNLVRYQYLKYDMGKIRLKFLASVNLTKSVMWYVLMECVNISYVDQDWKSTNFARCVRKCMCICFSSFWVQNYLSMT